MLISIIIPTYNRSNTLSAAVDSVFKQDYRPLEIVIVDDGSTDGTSELVKELEEKYNSKDFFLNYIIQENKGAPAARNVGLNNAKGEFIQYLDSDDLLDFNCISTKLEVYRKSNCKYSYSATDIIDFEGNFLGRMGRCKPNLKGGFLIPYSFHTSGPLVPLKLYKKIGPWKEDLNGCDEIEYFYRLKKEAGMGACIQKSLSFVRRIDDNHSHISSMGSSLNALAGFKTLFYLYESLMDTKFNSPEQLRMELCALSLFSTDVVKKCYYVARYDIGSIALQYASLCADSKVKKYFFNLILFLALFNKKTALKVFVYFRDKKGEY
jgi:glycosyltransferase involved in cell wall biosynthesis